MDTFFSNNNRSNNLSKIGLNQQRPPHEQTHLSLIKKISIGLKIAQNLRVDPQLASQ